MEDSQKLSMKRIVECSKPTNNLLVKDNYNNKDGSEQHDKHNVSNHIEIDDAKVYETPKHDKCDNAENNNINRPNTNIIRIRAKQQTHPRNTLSTIQLHAVLAPNLGLCINVKNSKNVNVIIVNNANMVAYRYAIIKHA